MDTEYKIFLTTQAVGQLNESKQYIAQTLLEPETARRWLEHMKAEMQKLSFMPTRNPLTDEEPWRSYGVRKLTVKNYLVYYIVKEEKAEVWITGVIYAHRDQLGQLRNMELDEVLPKKS